MAETIRSQSAIYSAAGNGAVSHIDVRDIAAVGARVLTEAGHERKAYELTGPAALTYGQIVDVLSRVLGRTIKYVPVTPEQYKQAAVAAGRPEAYADALVDLNHYYAEGRAARVSPAIKPLTGRDPIAFEQFARDYADRLR
jgi:uncharacterized protein YbjT (DUF2867 family)